MIRPAIVVAASLLVQGQAPRYGGALLRCAAFAEQADSRIAGRSGTASVRDRIGRSGVVVVTLRDSAGAIRVTAWYDSLALWRETGAGREVASTDGFVGGRYEGIVTPGGGYRRLRTPFVPEPLTDVADLAAILDDFLPRLPGSALEPGRHWRDSTGLDLVRLDDLEIEGRRLARYRWTADRRASRLVAGGDSGLGVELEQRIREEGELTWSPVYGPLAWSRTIGVDARVPARRGVKQSLATRVDQEIRVFRVFDHPACAARSH